MNVPSILLEVKANLTPGHYVAPNVGALIKFIDEHGSFSSPFDQEEDASWP